MFDPKCHALAAAFLDDHPHIRTPERINLLAQMIQNTIDSQIEHWTNLGPEPAQKAVQS
jgi:hypothetical protein